ncbi:MAG: oligosaccharide flippase family protein [Candidatus Nealsonbacteria bacterium]|nr:oligosaccharide flippase family protein [Candidatus Nealsonbacteria bacterium]
MTIKGNIYQFLRRTQKYTGLDNVYLAKGVSWLSLGQLGEIFFSLTLGIVWARFIPKEIFGQYKFVLSVASLFAIFSLTGMQASLVRSVAKGLEGTIKEVLKTKLRWSTLALLAGLSLAAYYWFQDNRVLAASFLIAGIGSPIINSFALYGAYTTGKKRFDIGTRYYLARNFLDTFAVFIAILFTKNIIHLILVYFAVNSFLAAFFYFLAIKKMPPNQKTDPEAIGYGKELSLLGLVGRGAEQIDKILVFHYLGAVELAIYSFATAMPNYIGNITSNLKELALPKLSAVDESAVKKTVLPRVIMYGLFLAAIILIYILLAEYIFKIFFPAYTESVFYSRIYALSFLGSVAFLPRLTLLARKKTGILFQNDITTTIVRISIIFVMLQYFGLLGIIVGQVIYSFIDPLIAFFFFKKSYSSKIANRL